MDQSDSQLGFPTAPVKNRVEELNRAGVEGYWHICDKQPIRAIRELANNVLTSERTNHALRKCSHG